MTRTVTVEERRVYGRYLFYPLDDNARRVAALLNRQAMTRTQMQLVKDLGFEIVYVAPVALGENAP